MWWCGLCFRPGMATIESNRMATIYTDNRSWAPSFVLLGSTKGSFNPLVRQGSAGRIERRPRLSSLHAPSYLLKTRDSAFLQVEHPEPVTWGFVPRSATPGAPSSSEEVPPGVEALRKALLPQVLRVIDLFRKLDANGDGKVTGVEFRRVLPLMASSASEAESFGEADVDSLFALLDRDGSGSIEYSELHARLRQGLSVALDKKLQAGAVGFDLEAKNRLSTYTLRGAADEHECQEASSAPADAPAAKVKSSDLGPYVAAQVGLRPPPARAGTQAQLLISPPVIGPAPHLAAKMVASRTRHAERIWFTMPGQNCFVLQPSRPGAPLPMADSPSRLRASVEKSRGHVHTAQTQAHHTSHALLHRSHSQQMDLCRRRHEQASPERLRRLASNHPPQQPTHLGGEVSAAVSASLVGLAPGSPLVGNQLTPSQPPPSRDGARDGDRPNTPSGQRASTPGLSAWSSKPSTAFEDVRTSSMASTHVAGATEGSLQRSSSMPSFSFGGKIRLNVAAAPVVPRAVVSRSTVNPRTSLKRGESQRRAPRPGQEANESL